MATMAARTPLPTESVSKEPKKSDYVPKDEYLAFAAAVRRHRQGSGFPTQARLGAALGVSWHAVGTWEKAIWAPAPDVVFELERLLALPGGTLSRLLGYLPVGAQPSVTAAIEADAKLDEAGKRLVGDVYRQVVRKRAVKSTVSELS
jgi:hypothetical protein